MSGDTCLDLFSVEHSELVFGTRAKSERQHGHGDSPSNEGSRISHPTASNSPPSHGHRHLKHPALFNSGGLAKRSRGRRAPYYRTVASPRGLGLCQQDLKRLQQRFSTRKMGLGVTGIPGRVTLTHSEKTACALVRAEAATIW